MNGVIYARYSSDNQREESIDGQVRECLAFAEKSGIAIVGQYIDRAYSATNDKRPDFQRMIEDSAKRLFDVVLVWKLDRFARDRFDSAIYKNTLKKNGVRLVSATEPITNSPEGILLEGMLETYNEYFSVELARKVKRGMNENALKCRYNGGTLPVGYTTDGHQNIIVDPVAAPAVLEAFERYADGKTIREIVEELDEKGVRTRRGGKININCMTRMLHNVRYTGVYKYMDYEIKGGIPAIVPEELFERVQARMAKTKRAPAQHKAEDDYRLTTKLRCGKCGAFMVGECGTSKYEGVVHHYYKCASVKKRKGCDKKAVRKKWIEDLVLEQVKKTIMHDGFIEKVSSALAAEAAKESTMLPLLNRQLAKIDKGIENMLNAIQAGIVTASTKARLESLEREKSEIEIRIAKEKIARPKADKEDFKAWLLHFRDFDLENKEQRMTLVDLFVNVIYLYDDHFDIFFNGQEAASKVELTEAQLKKARSRKPRRSNSVSSDLDPLTVPTQKHTIAVCFCVFMLATTDKFLILHRAPCAVHFSTVRRPGIRHGDHLLFHRADDADYIRVEVGAAFGIDYIQRVARGDGILVDAHRNERVEHVGDRHYPGGKRDRFAFEPAGIAGAVPAFVVGSGDLLRGLQEIDIL